MESNASVRKATSVSSSFLPLFCCYFRSPIVIPLHGLIISSEASVDALRRCRTFWKNAFKISALMRECLSEIRGALRC